MISVSRKTEKQSWEANLPRGVDCWKRWVDPVRKRGMEMQKKPIRFIISPKKILINNNTDMHEPTYRKRYRANPHEKGPYVRKVPYSPIPWNPWRACHVTRISTRISTMETRVESHLTHSPSFWLAAAPPCHSTSVTHASFAPHFSLNPGFCLIKPAAKVHPSQPSDA